MLSPILSDYDRINSILLVLEGVKIEFLHGRGNRNLVNSFYLAGVAADFVRVGYHGQRGENRTDMCRKDASTDM